MGGFERLRDLRRDGERLVDGNRPPCDASIETLTVDEFEHEELRVVGFVQTVNGADVRMVQRGENLGFTAESREALRVVREGVGQDLEGDITTELRIACTIDLAHAAHAESGLNFVWAKTRSRNERHDYFVGTRCFSSSNQLSTTSICWPPAVPDRPGEASTTPMKRCPSSVMS